MLLDTPVEISKQFRDVTYDPTIWKTVYASAPFPRPAGPFPYQSTQFLEHTLIQSERLAQIWTSQPVKATFRVLAPIRSHDSLHWQWNVLSGRWFIWLDSETTKILCQDLDGATGSRHILWDSDAQIVRFDACLVTSVDGQRVYIVVVGTPLGQGEQTTIKLLEFEVDDNSCSFLGPVSMDIPVLPRLPSSYSISGQWPFVCIREPDLVLVWDMRTRIFHKLPSFSSGLPHVTSAPIQSRLILSKTHVIGIYAQWRLSAYSRQHLNTILQAFVVPDSLPHSDSEGIRELRLTHEASMDHMSFSMRLLRNSVFDPVAKATNLRILNHVQANGDGGGTKFTCVDLTLSELSPGNVLPMSIHSQYLFNSDTSIGLTSTASSDDGHLRGVSSLFDSGPVGEFFLRRFSVDASKERCIAVAGKYCPMGRANAPNVITGKREFDGVGGRIYYTQKADREDCRNLVVVDLE
ncbi:hypothetical protein BU15DRAFT_63383 [Melanogaster broomeanus]|nr:hypothetical protein BU15DRAFT_63383 [Melanogaster broomeanus]